MRSIAARLPGSFLYPCALSIFGACSAPAPQGPDGGNNPPDGAGQMDGATGTDGAASGPGSLYPLAVGHRWTYAVAAVGGGSVCSAGSHDVRVTKTEMFNGKQAFSVTSFCSGVLGETWVAPEGERVYSNYSNQWLVLISTPIEEGRTWSYFNTSYTWHREGAVTVPAGTFSECWTARQNVTYTAYSTYCRGVGLVRSYSSDLTGSGWDARLASKSF